MMKNIVDSYKHIPSTIKHKVVILKLEKEFTGKVSLRMLLHDMDKIVMYVFTPFFGTQKIKEIHRSRKHHQYHLNHKTEIYKEMVLDWESARYTKPDKPMSARTFTNEVRPHLLPKILLILDKWGI